jgi:hypothetical protein
MIGIAFGLAGALSAPSTAEPASTRRPPIGVEIQPQYYPPQTTIRRPERPPSRSNAEPSSPIHDYLASPNARGGSPAGPLVAPQR